MAENVKIWRFAAFSVLYHITLSMFEIWTDKTTFKDITLDFEELGWTFLPLSGILYCL